MPYKERQQKGHVSAPEVPGDEINPVSQVTNQTLRSSRYKHAPSRVQSAVLGKEVAKVFFSWAFSQRQKVMQTLAKRYTEDTRRLTASLPGASPRKDVWAQNWGVLSEKSKVSNSGVS